MDHITRRQFLAGSSVSIALLAGCTGQNQNSGESGSDSSKTATRTATQAATQQEKSEHDEHGGNHSEKKGGHHGSEIPKSPSKKAAVAMVTENEKKHFKPHVVWIKPGGTVTWALESGTHSTTAYHPNNDKPLRIPEGGSAWNSGTLSKQGVTFEHTFDTKGVYDYFCIPHESLGMVGSVIVGRPEPSGQPGLEPPQAKLPKQAQQKIKKLNEMEREILS
jgi:plastocyanin